MYRSHHIGTDRIGRCCSCNTKICNFYFPSYGNDDILRFDISVDNSLCAASIPCTPGSQYWLLPYGKFSFSSNIFFQGNSLYQLHDDIINAVIFPYIIYIYNIRMRQSCCSLCFRSKFRNKPFSSEILLLQYLHRHKRFSI